MEATTLMNRTFQQARALHAVAWGMRWPRHSSTISQANIVPPATSADTDGLDIDEDNFEPGLAIRDFDGPATLTYDCLDNMNQVWGILIANTTLTDLPDVLVVGQEFDALLDIIENARSIVVLTGHTGNGNTAFLLYVLLDRLEHEKPTAVQFDAEFYFVFCNAGVFHCPSTLIHPELHNCWALVDSNERLTIPSTVIRTNAEKIIYVSSPTLETARRWMKQAMAHWILADLPSALEIGAIVQENGLATSSTRHLVRKYGPSIRTVVNIIRTGDTSLADAAAKSAASHVCTSPSSILPLAGGGWLPSSKVSDLVFCRPNRAEDGTVERMVAQCFIPTGYLHEHLDECPEALDLAMQQRLALVATLSAHSVVKAGPECEHEKRLHNRICIKGHTLCIFRNETTVYITPAKNLEVIFGPAAPQAVPPSTPFYWIPSALHFPGVDAVLSDANGSIYVLHATGSATTPVRLGDGLRRLWKNLPRCLKEAYTWNMIVVVPPGCEELANQLLAEFTVHMKEFPLDAKATRDVMTWACVL